jgi:hypothetical protein
MEDLVLAALLATIVATGVYLVVHRRLRPTGSQEWRQRWKRIDRPRRRRIARAVRRGEAVRDPRDAELAIELIDQIERQMAALQPRRRGRRIELFLVAAELLLVLGTLAAAVRAFDLVGALALLAPILFVVGLLFVARHAGSRSANRLTRARQANEALLSGLGYTRKPSSSRSHSHREGGLCTSSLTDALGDLDESRKN